MQLVAVMEAEVGALETWPTEILALVFAFAPHGPNVNLHLQTLVAFFFGNNALSIWPVSFSQCAHTRLFRGSSPESATTMSCSSNIAPYPDVPTIVYTGLKMRYGILIVPYCGR